MSVNILKNINSKKKICIAAMLVFTAIISINIVWYMDIIGREHIQDIIDDNTSADWSDYDKIKFAHDYIIENVNYDENAVKAPFYNTFMITNTLEDKIAVCAGYSHTFNAFMKCFGIPCKKVFNSTKTHEWNMVQLNGRWYNIDVTWDDPEEMKHLNKPVYTYFLQSTESFSKKDSGDNHKTNADLYPICEDTTFDNNGRVWNYESKNSDGSIPRFSHKLSAPM